MAVVATSTVSDKFVLCLVLMYFTVCVFIYFTVYVKDTWLRAIVYYPVTVQYPAICLTAVVATSTNSQISLCYACVYLLPVLFIVDRYCRPVFAAGWLAFPARYYFHPAIQSNIYAL